MSVSDNILKGLPGEPTLQGDLDLKDSDQSTTLFKVARDTGNTTIAGTLAVTGAVTLSSGLVRASQKRLIQNGAKVGATSGGVVNAADNKNSLFRVPASQTGSTLVIPISNLKVGDTITGYHLVGQIESAGNTCTVDASLRKQTAAAADLTDGAVTSGSMTQLSVTADTIMSSANTAVTGLADVVGADETFYLLVTVTTAASTDVDCQAVAVTVTES